MEKDYREHGYKCLVVWKHNLYDSEKLTTLLSEFLNTSSGLSNREGEVIK